VADTNFNPSDSSPHGLDDTLHVAQWDCDSDVARDSETGDGPNVDFAEDESYDNDIFYDDEDNLPQEGGSDWVDPRISEISTWDLMAEGLIVEAERLRKFLVIPVVRHSSPDSHQVKANLLSSRTISIIYACLK
jgi:hypothetical protein